MTTICAPATAPGGALAVIRVSGPDAIPAVDAIFTARSGHPLANRPGHTLTFGYLMDGESVLDEVVVSLFRAPHSYTGEDSVEISCHGSAYILQRTLQLLVAHGCSMAQPGEYTRRAFLSGKMDLSQAEAVADLIASQTAVSHRIAMQQMRGGYSQRLSQLRARLLQMTSLLELELDFSEEDVAFADRQQLTCLAEEIQAEVATLTHSFQSGNAFRNGIPVAIIGAPNVGKSTLLNRLLRDDRAIVSDIQGTTRDLIEDTIVLQGVQFRFIDTAGLRHSDDTIECLGMERSLQAAARARIIILLTEPDIPWPDIPLHEGQTVIRRINKTPTFQALTGIGMEALEQELIAAAPKDDNCTLLVTNQRHYEALLLAHTDISRALDALRANLPGDLVAEDLRQCLVHLGSILGEFTTDEVLGHIFSHFCIGK